MRPRVNSNGRQVHPTKALARKVSLDEPLVRCRSGAPLNVKDTVPKPSAARSSSRRKLWH
jgi:hypothetical protein